MVVWALVFMVFHAPNDTINWDGPWTAGQAIAQDQVFASEDECRNYAIEFIGRMHQGMLAPMRYACVEFPSTLPKGAPR